MEQVATTCDGMLPQAVYRAAYDAGRKGGVIVEVGTALGAATVALALGLRDSGLPGHVFSFDPMLGGPRRRQLAKVEDRVEQVRRNLRHFAVDHLVDLVTSDLPAGLDRLPAEPISVLMLDADGRIDRDLLAIYDRLCPAATILIDDVKDAVRLTRVGLTGYKVDAKMRLTWLLVETLKRDGVISDGYKIKDTYIGCKPVAGAGRIDAGAVLEAYREVIFTNTRLSPLSIAREKAIGALETWAPWLLQKARVAYRRSVKAPAAAMSGDSFARSVTP